MLKKNTLLFFTLLLTTCQLMASERTILVLGDSLSAGYGIAPDAGWVNLLRQRLELRQAPWRVINSSISGDTSAGGLARLPALLRQYRPRLVIIELGSNDGLRGLSFVQLRKNLAAMIQAVEQAGGEVVLVGGRLPPNYGSAYADAFHQLFSDLAKTSAVPLVPFLLEGVAQERALMQSDGYHPNGEAQSRLLENVWPVLEPALAGIGRKHESDG